MVEKRGDSSDEDVSDEEFDLKALLCARAFLSDDETEDEAEPTENITKQIILELTPISSIIASEEKCSSKEFNIEFEDKKSDEHEPKYRDSQLPHRMGAIRKRIMALGCSHILSEERRESDYTVNYAKRLQAIRQRIRDLRSSEMEENSSFDEPSMSSPLPSQRLLTPPGSPVLTRRTHAHIDISIPGWTHDNGDMLPYGQLDDSRDDRDEENPFLLYGGFGYKPDDSEDENRRFI